MNHKIAVIPGDGIGKEVMDEAIKVLEAINSHETIDINYDVFDWNSAYYLQHNRMMPHDGLDRLKGYDAILFGAIGDKRVPDHISVWELIMPIRKNFQQYVNLRPIKLLNGINSLVRTEADIDFTIIRENLEGEYSDAGGSMFHQEQRELAIQNTVMTRQGVNQIADFAFRYAREHGYNKVTNATKSNAITHVMTFWDKVVEEVAEQHQDIGYEKNYIDALAAYFVQRPHDFQVVVASNLFGDILSDLGSAIVGGLGITPSANINPEKNFPSMFEPVHGSSPDIAGKGIANPIAQIWSLALMLEHLGRKDLHDNVLTAIQSLLDDAEYLTPDLGGKATTNQAGDAIIKKLYN
ncbi:tartrate dehydrogenase [Virgibacillus siamensis]|uniref:tartrate dehydrogenase n=1 Tax=Virgibacillus siamensis TaxID=480071 RepID=UPI000984E967|nr:tartrate dehydrogenase [Virgibacillus siamensis]